MMLEHVLRLIEEDRLNEAIDFIEENPIVKVKESDVFRGDVEPWNDPIVLKDRVIFSTCWEEGDKYYGAIYVLDKQSLSLIKKFESEGYCKATEYANGKIYAGFDKTLYEFDLNLNILRKIKLNSYISDTKYYDDKLIILTSFLRHSQLYVLYDDFSVKCSNGLPYGFKSVVVTDGKVYVAGHREATWKIYEFDLNCRVIRESGELKGYIRSIYPFKGMILAGFSRLFSNGGIVLFNRNLKVLNKKIFDNVHHVKAFDDFILISGLKGFYIFDSKLNELSMLKYIKDYYYEGFTIDDLRIYTILDSDWERFESKLIVLDYLIPLKNRIEELPNLKGTNIYDWAKSLLLQLKLKEFDELLRMKSVENVTETTLPLKLKNLLIKELEKHIDIAVTSLTKEPVTITSIPAKINVKYPSKMRSNTRDIVRIEIIPECDIEGLTLDLLDLSRFFKVLHNSKPVTSVEFPPLPKDTKIVEEIELIPKYKGEFNANLIFRWKNLKKTVPLKITVKSIQSTFPIPKYEPIKLIGEGLTSYVYMCRRREDNKIVAVKIPKESEEAGKSFIEELANWKRLEHLNVVELYDYNIHPYPYAEMELCDCSLAEVKLDPLELATTLAKVLDYAHSKGVIHGDLKPSNILLKDGVIKVCDWGMGFTPAYAPPEVLEGNPPDELADIWSYGVILYEHITGKNPFQDIDDVKIYRKVLEVEPDFSNLGSFGKIVERCLRKDPKERFQSFAEIKRELANISITEYSRRFSTTRGKDRLHNLIMLTESYELAGDIKTAKERIDDGIVIIKDDHSRKILEAMSVLMDIREICLKSIYERKSVEVDRICMKFDNFLSYLDEGIQQAIENDPYAGQIIRYLKTVSTGALGYEELERIYHIACERIFHLLKS